jgi:adenosylhomocysteine nucleosidase
VRILVLAALRAELRPALRQLHAARRRAGGAFARAAGPFLFAAGGVGATAAAEAARRLIDAFRPDALVSTGFAGALDDSLGTGDLVLGGTTGFPAEEGLLRLAREAAPGARAGDVHAVARILNDTDAKRRLARETGALAVDMESAAVGRAAREYGLGFLCVKAVLDTPAAPLATDYASVRAVLGKVLRRPRRTLAGIRDDAARARTAAERLGAFYARWVKRLGAGG